MHSLNEAELSEVKATLALEVGRRYARHLLGAANDVESLKAAIQAAVAAKLGEAELSESRLSRSRPRWQEMWCPE